MEDGGYAEASHYVPSSAPYSRQGARVNPNHSLPSPIRASQIQQRSPLTNYDPALLEDGLSRNTSRRRKPTGQVYTNNLEQPSGLDALPPAPDAPRPPQVSYRGPYDNGDALPGSKSSPRSFAARARTAPDNVDPNLANSAADTMPPVNNSRHSRRGSIKQPPGSTYHQIQRLAIPLLSNQGNDPSSPLSSTNATSPKQRRTSIRGSAPHTTNTIESPRYSNGDPSPGRSNTKQASIGAIESPSEWAADRSPLQKLEVKLNDISKEEKRARVQEAEQRLRESKAAKAIQTAKDEPNTFVGSESSKHEPAINGYNRPTELRSPVQHRTEGSPHVRGEDLQYKNAAREPIRDRKDNGFEGRRNASGPATYQRSAVEEAQTVPNRAVSQTQPQRNHQKSSTVVDTERSDGRAVRFQNQGEIAASHNAEGQFTFDSGDATKDVKYGVAEASRQDHRRLSSQHTSGYATNLDDTSRRQVPIQQQQLFNNKAEIPSGTDSASAFDRSPDPLPPHAVRTQEHAVKYEVPPQTASGIDAREKIGFGSSSDTNANVPGHKHRISGIFHHSRHQENHESSIPNTGPPKHLDEWRQGGVARLTLADNVTDVESTKGNKAWWEGKPEGQLSSSAGLDGGFDDTSIPTTFNPQLYLRCGPLLRYTGIRRDKIETSKRRGQSSMIDRETWRGSVMIVTSDVDSSYEPVPTLRLFHQHINLLPPPLQQFDGEDGGDLPSEYVDPIAGLPKMDRTGRTVYVKPVEDLDEGVDVSQLENDEGLYEVTRTANVPTAYGKADELLGRSPLPTLSKNRNTKQEGKRTGKYREVRGVRLHAERGLTFWRFNLEVELGESQTRIAYRINKAASIGFWVPARGQTMNVMFHSCNGFSLSVNPANFSGPDPLWRDVLNTHQTKPFHAMIGGGDQIYNDAVMRGTKLFQEWLGIKNPHHKHEAEFSQQMQDELQDFYLERYAMWFSQGLFGMANSQIPMINIWDDHDIIDGFGSYPHHFMSTPVFSGLGNVAFKYYMLFQHQSVPDELSADEPSWLLGASRGPYINEFSRSLFLSLGKRVAFLGLDCRTERMRDEVLSEATYSLIFERCRREILEGETKHLIVLLGVPIAYPRLVWLENILTSRVMDPIKALGRTGMLGGFLNQFDGGVEILDDLDDHWTARNHKDERNWFIQELQDLAAEKSVRVTILGGDVHLAAIGQFYSNPKLKIPKDRDHRYMPNVISSAIVNTPPPEVMGDILNKRNKVHHLDHETDEDMIPMFTHDVNGKSRNNKRLLPRRNWCSITEYHPGSTPPPTPPSSSPADSDNSLPQQPPNRLQRTLSLTRGDSKPRNLLRRLSQRGQISPHYSPSNEYHPSSAISPNARASSDGYFPPQPKPATSERNGNSRIVSAPLPTRPINSFQRRPTNLSEKAVAKGGLTDGEISLEHGLDIVLNCEVNQRDPAGCTVPYRLLVPALYYTGNVEENEGRGRKESWFSRLGSRRGSTAARQGAGEWGGDSETGSETESESDRENMRYGPGRLGFLRKGHGQQQQHSGVVIGKATRNAAGQITGGQPMSQQSSAQSEPHTGRTGGALGRLLSTHKSASPQSAPPQQSHFPARDGATVGRQVAGSQPMSPQSSTSQGNPSMDRLNGNLGRQVNTTQPLSPYSPPTQTNYFPTRGSSAAAARAPPGGSEPVSPDSLLNEGSPIRQRRGSKFDPEGNSKFFGAGQVGKGQQQGGGGKVNGSAGYGGIEAYREKEKGWRRFF